MYDLHKSSNLSKRLQQHISDILETKYYPNLLVWAFSQLPVKEIYCGNDLCYILYQLMHCPECPNCSKWNLNKTIMHISEYISQQMCDIVIVADQMIHQLWCSTDTYLILCKNDYYSIFKMMPVEIRKRSLWHQFHRSVKWSWNKHLI